MPQALHWAMENGRDLECAADRESLAAYPSVCLSVYPQQFRVGKEK